jgi:hypothetical protein
VTACPSRKSIPVTVVILRASSPVTQRRARPECSGQQRTRSRESQRHALWPIASCCRSAIDALVVPSLTRDARHRRSPRGHPPLLSRPRPWATIVRLAIATGRLTGPGARWRGAARTNRGGALLVSSTTIATPPTLLGRRSGPRTRRPGVVPTQGAVARRRSPRS